MMAENRGQANDAQRQTIVPRNMGKNMYRLRNSEKSFTDLVIKTRDGKQLPVHKAALASASDYFVTMFSTEMREKYSDIVEMKNMASDVLESVINFIYDQPIIICEERIYELVDAAEYLQVPDLKTECQKFLLASTKPSNCLKHRLYAKRYNMKEVTEKADEVIAGNFEDISEKKEFQELNYDDLETILQMQLENKSEEIVFSAIVKWAKHDMDGRQKYFDSLFLSIDISLLTSEFIEAEVLNEILVNKTKASVLRVSKELMSRIKLEKSYVPRRIGIIGGFYTKNDVVVFDPDEKKIQHLPKIQFHLIYPVAVRNGDDLYVIEETTSKVISLNLKNQNNKWEEVTTIPQPKRYGFRFAVLNGFIYLAGGGSGVTHLSSVIKYDLSNNVWSDVKSMNEKREEHALVPLKEKLFAIAGWNGKNYLKTVEMYDADKNQWIYVSSLNEDRSLTAATVFNGRIYVTGGCNRNYLSSVEMWDPNEDVWMMIKDLNVPRRCHGSCVVDGKLYVVGGCKSSNGSIEDVKSIEVYDPDKNEWKICGELDKKRRFSAVCAM